MIHRTIFSALLLNPVGETSRLSFDVEVAGDNPSIGIAVHVGETFTVGYYLLIDFGRRRIEFKSGVRMTERGGQMFPYEVELERLLPMSTGKNFFLLLLLTMRFFCLFVWWESFWHAFVICRPAGGGFLPRLGSQGEVLD